MFYKYDIITVNYKDELRYIVRRKRWFGLGRAQYCTGLISWVNELHKLALIFDTFNKRNAEYYYEHFSGIKKLKDQAKAKLEEKKLESTVKVYNG